MTGFSQCGYNGEDFLDMALKTLTWIPMKSEAAIFKPRSDADGALNKYNEIMLAKSCPEFQMCKQVE